MEEGMPKKNKFQEEPKWKEMENYRKRHKESTCKNKYINKFTKQCQRIKKKTRNAVSSKERSK